jgi:hypothetical protein
VEIIDLRISYQKGAPIAYIRPLTTHGRHWRCRIERDRGRRAVTCAAPANGGRRIDDSLAVVLHHQRAEIVIVWLAAQRSTFHAAYAIIAVVNRQIAISVATSAGAFVGLN